MGEECLFFLEDKPAVSETGLLTVIHVILIWPLVHSVYFTEFSQTQLRHYYYPYSEKLSLTKK